MPMLSGWRTAPRRLGCVRARSDLAPHFVQVFHKVGLAGLDLVTNIVIGDVSPLEWRALFYGMICWCSSVSWLYHALIVICLV